ncbi:hypothetical protein GFS24_11510 [Chitinophaga sp. SYP-B3965]|uniref:hypothetical protein n=1 Tax=Chitinophaga sp. SYP-B3965 TaxID=2663120 RepID=UPI00129950DD|nr:hypothetical protein [Chitinophaga sp. SYP-B3965]MRG45747.1 hypothetical protein [Chitinophaga sp. SYP-B3965]
MKITLPLLFITSLAFGQTDSIVQEGKLLYKSEMASWNGTDIFLENFKDEQGNIGGYLSYNNNCIFFSKDSIPKVLATISFDSTYSAETAKINKEQRGFTPEENDLYVIRKRALAEINSGGDKFKRYNNTDLNLIPLIHNGVKKVYVLTGPKVTGVVIFGNDYLLTFDKDNKLMSTQVLHKNIIPITYKKSEETNLMSVHNHLPETGDFITATDVCTLMLYEKYANWKQHYVISEKNISLWDCEKDELVSFTKEAWEKITKDQEEKKQIKQ